MNLFQAKQLLELNRPNLGTQDAEGNRMYGFFIGPKERSLVPRYLQAVTILGSDEAAATYFSVTEFDIYKLLSPIEDIAFVYDTLGLVQIH